MSDDSLKLVNASGFAFQLAVEERVRLSGLEDRHNWTIVSREHGWRDGDVPRFIDLVLSEGHVHLVIECKRARGAEWVFLVPDPPQGRRAELRRHFRAQYLRKEDSAVGPKPVCGSYDFQVDPRSGESAFCVVRGNSETDRPMLDRICAELARSADAVLEQQMHVGGGFHPSEHWTAIPVIVTAAQLRVCRFDPGIVSLADGQVPANGTMWEDVTHARYRKSFDALPATSAATLGDLEKQAQRTVEIVMATHLVDWLEQFHIEEASYAR